MDSSVPPPELVANLTLGHLAARCLHLIAEHGVADALGEQSATAEELAKRSGTNADALGRMLRFSRRMASSGSRVAPTRTHRRRGYCAAITRNRCGLTRA